MTKKKITPEIKAEILEKLSGKLDEMGEIELEEGVGLTLKLNSTAWKTSYTFESD